MAKEELIAFAAKHNVTMKAEFVPFSKSRNKDNKYKSLNWRVTVLKNNREMLTTDFSAGEAHCPAYKNKKSHGYGFSVFEREAIDYELEHGKESRGERSLRFPGKPILPDLCDVLHSLQLDSDVLNYSNFEDWAREFGYDGDSRSAERLYRLCLEIALKLRNGLGEEALRELEEAARDY